MNFPLGDEPHLQISWLLRNSSPASKNPGLHVQKAFVGTSINLGRTKFGVIRIENGWKGTLLNT